MTPARTESFASVVTSGEPTEVCASAVTGRATDHGLETDGAGLSSRSGLRLLPDRGRVFAELFVPGEEVPGFGN